jgi:hypothetical protein
MPYDNKSSRHHGHLCNNEDHVRCIHYTSFGAPCPLKNDFPDLAFRDSQECKLLISQRGEHGIYQR